MEMQCGSAITSVNHAAAMIALGYVDVLMVGGMESYSTMNAEFSMNDEPYKLILPTSPGVPFGPTKDEGYHHDRGQR